MDFSQLNQITERDCVSLPSVETITERVSNSECMSVLRVEGGLFQVVIDEESRDKTSFVSHVGRFHLKN